MGVSRLSVFALAVGVCGAASSAPRYRVEAVPHGDKLIVTSASDINDDGVVVGSARPDKAGAEAQGFKVYKPYRYRDGVVKRLDLEGYFSGAAQAVNRRGEVTGNTDSGRIWDKKGHPSSLGAAPNCDGYLTATDINDAGEVAGYIVCTPYRAAAGVYTGGAIVELPALPGHTASAGYAINRSGVVAGYSLKETDHDNYFTHAVVWEGGAAHDLGTLGGKSSEATDINASRQVVGLSQDVDGVWRPFIHDGNSMQPLPNCGDGVAVPDGINASGQVVATWYMDVGEGSKPRAVLWDEGECHVLSDLLDDSGEGWVLLEAHGINSAGQIVGSGRHHGEERAFIVTPLSR